PTTARRDRARRRRHYRPDRVASLRARPAATHHRADEGRARSAIARTAWAHRRPPRRDTARSQVSIEGRARWSVLPETTVTPAPTMSSKSPPRPREVG